MRLLYIFVAVLVGSGSVAMAQGISVDVDPNGSISAVSLQLFALITILGLAPGIAIMVTCFPFVVTVLSILRQALGLQQSPPNMLIVSLAMFLTYYIMDPVLTKSWQNGVAPVMAQKLSLQDAWPNIIEPFRNFMQARVLPEVLDEFLSLRPQQNGQDAVPLSTLIPSFMISEITRAFQIGFLIFLPFLIIDLVVSAVLMSMGMMMVPPAVVALPFKLAFFAVANGWTLISTALVRGYVG